MKSLLAHKTLSFTHEAILALLLVGLMLLAAHLEPKFVTAFAQQRLSSQIWEIALLALPMTLIIITGGIDLSVGSTMALVSVALGILFQDCHLSLPLACVFALLVGAACGLVNGLFITLIKVHPLIITLATMSAFRGLAEAIGKPDSYSDFPDVFYNLAKTPVHWKFGIPDFYDTQPPLLALQAAGWLFLAGALTTAIVLAATPFGRRLYAIGYNETAARFSGIRVNHVKVSLYMLSGLTAGIAAIVATAGQNSAKADVGTGVELEVITAVVLGGTRIFGGRGRLIGTVLGVALIHETRQFVKWHYHRDEWVSVVLGTLLIVAVAANALLARKSLRK
jgi:rhamnose transport system permease protein